MPTLAIANLRDVNIGDDIVEYLNRIDATLAPYQGRFLIHGGPLTPLEGNWQGTPVIISFPDRAKAEAWYRSEVYQVILPLRLNNSSGDVILADTVSEDHKAPDVLKTN
jgi:uncharacterized protein (DUF1330 family)